MVKKIKSFTVDEDIYNALVALFKENKAQASLSSFVNNSLKQLLHDIHLFIEAREHIEGYDDIPLSFVINEMVNDAYKVQASRELMGEEDRDRELIACGEYFKKRFEASKLQIPVAFYNFISTGLYVLSADRQYLIHKDTGKKYLPDGEDSLREIGKTHK